MLQKKAVIVFLLFVFCGYCLGCGSKHKTKEEHYPDGKLKAIYTYNDAGKLDGVVKQYDKKGILMLEETYKNNVKDGIEKTYYENGKLLYERNWKNGKPDGIYKSYYGSGILMSEGISKGDKSTKKNYYGNGKLESEVTSQGNDSTTKYYYENGNLGSEVIFKDGKRDGIKMYYENGKLKFEEKFKDNIMVSRTCYDKQGNKIECPH